MTSNNVPLQYKNYIFGSVDPNFTKIVINRTSKNNDLKVLQKTYHGFGQRGIDPKNVEQSIIDPLWQFKLGQSIPFLPGKIFFDVASVLDKSLFVSNYISSGYELGPFIMPMYQSWGTKNYPGGVNWFKDRIRIRIPTINF